MASNSFNPWWKRVNEYLQFHELEEFTRGVTGYRPNAKQDALLGLISAGYVRKSFDKPESYTGKKKQ